MKMNTSDIIVGNDLDKTGQLDAASNTQTNLPTTPTVQESYAKPSISSNTIEIIRLDDLMGLYVKQHSYGTQLYKLTKDSENDLKVL